MSRQVWFVMVSVFLLVWTLWYSPPEKISLPNKLGSGKVEVVIAGKSFGEFEPSMDVLLAAIEVGPSLGQKVLRFNREFVSKPSFYNWAEDASKELLTTYEIEVRETSRSGRSHRRLRLFGCRPLNWVISERDLMGSFYEEVVIVAQKVDPSRAVAYR